MAKLDFLELVDCCGTNEAVYDFGGAGSEEEFDDAYFSQQDTDKISHLWLEDLELDQLEGSGSIPIAADDATLSAGIWKFSPPLSYRKTFMISDHFIHASWR